MATVPPPAQTAPAPSAPTVHTLWAHTLVTIVAVGVVFVAVEHHLLHPYFLAGAVLLACGWVTPQVALQLLAAYQRALLTTPPAQPPPPTDRLPPPGSLGLLALLGPLAAWLRHGSPGRSRTSTLLTILVVAVLTLAGVAVLGALTQGCGPGRELVMRVAPGVPLPASCSPAGASRCSGSVPEVCSASGRWWPATPASAPCAHGCVADDAGAYCAAADAAVSP